MEEKNFACGRTLPHPPHAYEYNRAGGSCRGRFTASTISDDALDELYDVIDRYEGRDQ